MQFKTQVNIENPTDSEVISLKQHSDYRSNLAKNQQKRVGQIIFAYGFGEFEAF